MGFSLFKANRHFQSRRPIQIELNSGIKDLVQDLEAKVNPFDLNDLASEISEVKFVRPSESPVKTFKTSKFRNIRGFQNLNQM